MQITRNGLVSLLKEAFDCGQGGSYELREQHIEEIMWLFQQGQQSPWEVMSLKSLRSLPTGRKLYHSLFGEGVLCHKSGEKYVQFSGFRMELLEEGWPWDQKVQVIY